MKVLKKENILLRN